MHLATPEYDIFEHRHRFAAWAAGRAYSRRGPGHDMSTAMKLLTLSGLSSLKTPDDLPEPDKVDAFLDKLIVAVMRVASEITYLRKSKSGNTVENQLLCSYGRAQKLVNIYLKSKLVCSGWETHASVVNLHPPLDSVLIKSMGSYTWKNRSQCSGARLAFERAQQLGNTWTSFDRATYDAYIDTIKIIQRNAPLWAIEWLWQPAKDTE